MKFLTIIFHSFLIYFTISDKNSVMSRRASTNNADVISIMIPEDPDNNLNIDQLTLDFRRQLGRLILQNRINKMEANRFRYAPNDPALLKQKNSLKNRRQKLNRYSLSKFDNRGRSQAKKPPTYRSNLLKQLRLKIRSDVFRNERKFRPNNWRQISNLNCGKKDLACRSKFFNDPIRNNQSLLEITGQKTDYRKQKLQSVKDLNNLRINDRNNFMVPNIGDVEFSNLQRSDSIPDCSRKIDENGKEFLFCFNGSAINLPEKMIENKNDFFNKEKDGNNPSLNDVKSQETVYPINIQVNDYKDVEKILQNPETALKHINPFDMEKNVKFDINSKKSEDVRIEDILKKNLIKSVNSNGQLSKIDDDYSGDPVDRYELKNKQGYDSINQDQSPVDNGDFPLRTLRSISNNPFSKTPTIDTQQHGDEHKLELKEKFGLLKLKD